MFKPGFLTKYFILLMIFVSSAVAYSPQFADVEKNKPLKWQDKRIPISISTSVLDKATNIKTKSDVFGAINRSFKHWESVANIEFDLTFTNLKSVSDKGTVGDGVSLITISPTSENLLLFDEDIEEFSAITRLFFSSNGTIKEADIVLNPIALFSTDGTFRSFDLEATLTHEIGHLIGLGHSQIIGSTMHKHQGKNGIYDLSGFSPRTLSEDDKAGAITLYGKKRNNDLCCTTIDGELTFANNPNLQKLNVWAEDSLTGKVIAGITTDSDGNFRMSGLPKGFYKVFAQDELGKSATVSLGYVDLSKSKVNKLKADFVYRLNELDIQYIGFNGQVSNLAVPVNAGKSYKIYLGGKNLNRNEFEIEFHSDNFKIIPTSILDYDYGEEISVVSFEVEIAEDTPSGEYSFYLKDKKGKVENLIGGLTLERKINTKY